MSSNKHKIWHPFTQHGLEKGSIFIDHARDEFLYTKNGKQIIDAISSWWVNTLGHGHPAISEAITNQAKQLEQVIFAGFTHQPAETLADELLKLTPDKLQHVFYSDSGSTSVEVALKMAVGYWYNKGLKNKTRIIAMEESYHGDTFGGMSSGARSVFNQSYHQMLFDVIHIPFPYEGQEQKTFKFLKDLLKNQHSEIAAIILEPLILGAGGMLFYPPEVLEELYKISKEYDVFFILDEVMTGWGRTGTMFAYEQTSIVPDIICLSKGLTGGFLPLAATIATEEIFNGFYAKDKSKMFFHSSSYTANPIACAAAVANIKVWQDDNILEKVKYIETYHSKKIQKYKLNENIKNIRHRGTIAAFDFITKEEGYLSDIGNKLYDFYLERNVLLRPLGNVIYIMPPYCISTESLDKIYDVIDESLEYIQTKKN